MSEHFLISLAVIILFGMLSQWMAWRFHLPSILLLLVLGIVAGPVSGLVQTKVLFGNLLFPFVSLAVAIILFEGGLSLKFSEFRNIGSVIRNLISVGALITWIISAFAAYYLLDLELKFAILFGAILIVTGPTVILPLLRQIRPRGNLYSIAKWEGIIIDPVGAVLAVLVFEEIVNGGFEQFSYASILGLLKTGLVGVALGWLGAQLIILFLRRYWIPDYLHNAAAIMMVITSFTISNLIQNESGLLTVTILGIVLANQKTVSIRHIIEFKENLRVILISTLFIVLAATLKVDDLRYLDLNMVIFLGILILVARPLSVFISTIGQKLNIRERIFLSWLAPRGIVAASVASIFALELSAYGYTGAERLIPLTFMVIIATVSLYGLTAGPLARVLRLSEQNPQGILIVGAHAWARQLGKEISKQNVRVLMIDSNTSNVENARTSGLEAITANVLAEDVIDQLDLQGIGRILAVTPNDEVNALATMHFKELFGSAEVYQLPYKRKEASDEQPVSIHLRGRRLFAEDMSYARVAGYSLVQNSIKTRELLSEEDLQFVGDDKILPLVLIDSQKNLLIYTDEKKPTATIGMQLIYQVISES